MGEHGPGPGPGEGEADPSVERKKDVAEEQRGGSHGSDSDTDALIRRLDVDGGRAAQAERLGFVSLAQAEANADWIDTIRMQLRNGNPNELENPEAGKKAEARRQAETSRHAHDPFGKVQIVREDVPEDEHPGAA